MKQTLAISDFPMPDTSKLETKLLATMIGDQSTIGRVMRSIKADMFTHEENRKIWETIIDMYNSGENIDLTTVLPRVNRSYFLSTIIDETPEYGEMGLQGLIGAMVDTCVRRAAYITAVDALQRINGGMPCSEICRMFGDFSKMTADGLRDDMAKTSTEVANTLSERLEKGETNRIPTSIRTLDFYTYGGFNGGNLVILAARPSVGKAQPMHTKVLTPQGWLEMGSLKVGDKVIGRDGRAQDVLGVYPQGVRPVYRVEMNDGASVLCDEEHLWTVTDVTSSRHREQELTLKEMMRRGLKTKLTPSRAASNRKPLSKYRIPKVAPVEFAERQLPIDPYLLGLLIGDGYLCGNAVSISNPLMDVEMITRASGRLPDGYEFHKNSSPACPSYVIAQKIKGGKDGFARRIRRLGLDVRSRDKFIPQEYLLGSVGQRLSLLRGLMDTDGTASDGATSFSTTSRRLADDMVSLVRTLGGLSYVKAYDRTEEGKGTEYNVAVSMTVCPFHLRRKAERWRPSDRSRFITSAEKVGDMECVCIYVSNDDHCYVTEDYIVTHNTTIALQMALHASKSGKKSMIFSLEMTAEELVQRLILSTGYISPAALYSRRFEWADYERAVAETCNDNLIINDKANGIDELCQRIRVECQSGHCRFAVIDYLGLIPVTNQRQNIATALGEFTRKLKTVAKECDIPILLLCQLNRASASEMRSPQLFDLRDSGAIEQDADLVLMLERTRTSDGDIVDNSIDLWIRKNRNGKCNFDSPIRLVGTGGFANFEEHGDED